MEHFVEEGYKVMLEAKSDIGNAKIQFSDIEMQELSPDLSQWQNKIIPILK